MRVVRADVGATCVYVPSRQIIIIDPALGHEEAVVVIQATLPRAHPDAVRHWVEAVLPTRSLSDTLILEFRDIPVRSHRRPKLCDTRKKRCKMVLAAAGLLVIAATGGFGVAKAAGKSAAPIAGSSAGHSDSPAMSDPLALPAPHVVHQLADDAADPSPKPSASTTPFEDVVFDKIEDHLKWRCSAVDGQAALMATCRTPLGLSMDVEKYVGPKAHTYILTYRGLTRAERVTLKVFADDAAKGRLMASAAANHSLFPNLVSGPNWAMYGSDRFRINLWALGIGDKLDPPLSKQPSPETTTSSGDRRTPSAPPEPDPVASGPVETLFTSWP